MLSGLLHPSGLGAPRHARACRVGPQQGTLAAQAVARSGKPTLFALLPGREGERTAGAATVVGVAH